MLNVPLKIRRVLNSYSYSLAIKIDSFLKEKLGEDYEIESFKFVSFNTTNRFIKINVNGKTFRINLEKKSYFRKREGLWHEFYLYLEGKDINEIELDIFSDPEYFPYFQGNFYKRLKVLKFNQFNYQDTPINELEERLRILLLKYRKKDKDLIEIHDIGKEILKRNKE